MTNWGIQYSRCDFQSWNIKVVEVFFFKSFFDWIDGIVFSSLVVAFVLNLWACWANGQRRFVLFTFGTWKRVRKLCEFLRKIHQKCFQEIQKFLKNHKRTRIAEILIFRAFHILNNYLHWSLKRFSSKSSLLDNLSHSLNHSHCHHYNVFNYLPSNIQRTRPPNAFQRIRNH